MGISFINRHNSSLPNELSLSSSNKLYDVGEIFKYSQSASSLIYLQIFKEIGTSFLRMKDGSELKTYHHYHCYEMR